MKRLASVLLIAVLPLIVIGCGEPSPAEKQAQVQSDIDAQAMIDARTAVESALRDPSSAQFHVMTIAHLKGEKFDLPFYVCGNVNAKNGFGGYVGQKSFIVYTLVPKISGASPVVDWQPKNDLWDKCGKTIDAKQQGRVAGHKFTRIHRRHKRSVVGEVRAATD